MVTTGSTLTAVLLSRETKSVTAKSLKKFRLIVRNLSFKVSLVWLLTLLLVSFDWFYLHSCTVLWRRCPQGFCCLWERSWCHHSTKTKFVHPPSLSHSLTHSPSLPPSLLPSLSHSRWAHVRICICSVQFFLWGNECHYCCQWYWDQRWLFQH